MGGGLWRIDARGLSNDVVEMISKIQQETGKTATEIVEESIRNEDSAYKLARLLSEKS